MAYNDLSEIINNDLVVDIGHEPSSNRVHKLFYSKPDNMCFVAIQDIKTATIITVLPIDYHENISWRVSIDSQSQAKNLIVKKPVETKPDESKIANTSPTVFIISATITDYYGKYVAITKLGNWPCKPYNYSINALILDEEFINVLTSRINDKHADIKNLMQFIHAISIKLGSKGEPVFFLVSDIVEGV